MAIFCSEAIYKDILLSPLAPIHDVALNLVNLVTKWYGELEPLPLARCLSYAQQHHPEKHAFIFDLFGSLTLGKTQQIKGSNLYRFLTKNLARMAKVDELLKIHPALLTAYLHQHASSLSVDLCRELYLHLAMLQESRCSANILRAEAILLSHINSFPPGVLGSTLSTAHRLCYELNWDKQMFVTQLKILAYGDSQAFLQAVDELSWPHVPLRKMLHLAAVIRAETLDKVKELTEPFEEEIMNYSLNEAAFALAHLDLAFHLSQVDLDFLATSSHAIWFIPLLQIIAGLLYRLDSNPQRFTRLLLNSGLLYLSQLWLTNRRPLVFSNVELFYEEISTLTDAIHNPLILGVLLKSYFHSALPYAYQSLINSLTIDSILHIFMSNVTCVTDLSLMSSPFALMLISEIVAFNAGRVGPWYLTHVYLPRSIIPILKQCSKDELFLATRVLAFIFRDIPHYISLTNEFIYWVLKEPNVAVQHMEAWWNVWNWMHEKPSICLVWTLPIS